jgi:hypothetical protein
MNRGRVGEDRGSKETDRCPLTLPGHEPMRVQTWFAVDTPSYLSPLRIRLLHVTFSVLNSFVKRPSKPYQMGCSLPL